MDKSRRSLWQILCILTFSGESSTISQPCEYRTYVMKPSMYSSPNERKMSIELDSELTIIEQTTGFTFGKLLADVGGYIGLFWGISILDIADHLRFHGFILQGI